MTSFGDIRSAIHNDNPKNLATALFMYKGNSLEAGAIAQYVIKSCDQLPSRFIWKKDGTIEMRVGQYRPTVMNVTQHAFQSVTIGFRKKAQKILNSGMSSRSKADYINITDAIEDWLKSPTPEYWEAIEKQANSKISCKQAMYLLSVKAATNWLNGAYDVTRYMGNSLHEFMNLYSKVYPDLDRIMFQRHVNHYLLKEYVCPPSVI